MPYGNGDSREQRAEIADTPSFPGAHPLPGSHQFKVQLQPCAGPSTHRASWKDIFFALSERYLDTMTSHFPKPGQGPRTKVFWPQNFFRLLHKMTVFRCWALVLHESPFPSVLPCLSDSFCPPVAPRISPSSVVSGSPRQVGNSRDHRDGMALTLDRAVLQASSSPVVGIPVIVTTTAVCAMFTVCRDSY